MVVINIIHVQSVHGSAVGISEPTAVKGNIKNGAVGSEMLTGRGVGCRYHLQRGGMLLSNGEGWDAVT